MRPIPDVIPRRPPPLGVGARAARRRPEGGPPPGRIAVFRALMLGDMLCAVPALRALRAGFPEAEIVLVGLPWAREFAARFAAYVDGFREFPGYPGLPERTPDGREAERFFDSMRRERFDLALQLHGSGVVSNEVTARFGARRLAGFHAAGSPPPDGGGFIPYPGEGLEIRRLLRLVERLGLRPAGEHLEFPLREEECRDAERLLAAEGAGLGPYACIHGGASVPERRWPAERFARVADALAARGLGVVLTGSAGEAELTRSIARAMSAPSVDLAGKTPLGVLGAVLERSRLLVCNDTGVSHVADGLRVPSVVISTGDNPARWAPPDERLHRVLCRAEGPVPVGEVLDEAGRLLDSISTRLMV